MTEKFQRFFFCLALAVPLCLILGRAVADVAVGIVGLGFLYRSWRLRDFSWLRQPWVRLALVIWTYLVLSGSLALYDVPGGVARGLSWGRFPLFAIAFGHWLLPLDKDYKFLRWSLGFLLAAVALDALLQFVTGRDIIGYPVSTYAHRLSGPFRGRLVVGLFLSRLAWPLIGLLLAAGLRQTGMLRKYALPLLLTGLIGLAILLSGERMAFGIFTLCAFFFWLGARGLRLPLLGVGVATAALAVLLIALNPTLHSRFVTTTAPVLRNFERSSYGAILNNALIAWKMAPLTGVGPKNFVAACLAQGQALSFAAENKEGGAFNCARHPHNIYLEWLAETGLIGFGLFIALVMLWSDRARLALRRAEDLPRYYIALGFAVGLLPFLWPIMTSMSFFINWSAILFWWALGLLLSLPVLPLKRQKAI